MRYAAPPPRVGSAGTVRLERVPREVDPTNRIRACAETSNKMAKIAGSYPAVGERAGQNQVSVRGVCTVRVKIAFFGKYLGSWLQIDVNKTDEGGHARQKLKSAHLHVAFYIFCIEI